jgi:cytochrome c oxidase subunit 3
MRPTLAAIEPETPHAVTVSLGIWTFLATEILFFGGLFVAYTLYRFNYPGIFEEGAREMELWSGGLNTALLLTSSLLLGIADRAVRVERRGLLRACLWGAALLGVVFLWLKALEYRSHAEHGLIPGPAFRPGEDPRLQMYFFLYFAMTGLHAVHMIAGVGAIAWLLWQEGSGRIGPERPEPVAVVGIYWGFVDCIWMLLFPLFYLPGR